MYVWVYRVHPTYTAHSLVQTGPVATVSIVVFWNFRLHTRRSASVTPPTQSSITQRNEI